VLADDAADSRRWHDCGKVHPIFQVAMPAGAPRADIWAKSKGKMMRYQRPGFRHELSSAIAMLLNGHSDLAAYLVAAHHGKVRLSIRSLPTKSNRWMIPRSASRADLAR